MTGNGGKGPKKGHKGTKHLIWLSMKHVNIPLGEVHEAMQGTRCTVADVVTCQGVGSHLQAGLCAVHTGENNASPARKLAAGSCPPFDIPHTQSRFVSWLCQRSRRVTEMGASWNKGGPFSQVGR